MSAPTNTSNGDWPMFHHDPAHTGYTNGTAPTYSPSLLWTTGSEGSKTNFMPASPVVANGIAYTAHGKLYAYNASTGEPLWTRGDGYLSPIVENGVIYTAGGAFNASTGIELWNSTKGQIVAVANGYYYSIYIDPLDLNKGILNKWWMFAQNASTGITIWDYSTESRAYTPSVAGGIIIFGTDSKIYCLNALTGAKLWDFAVGVLPDSSSAIFGSHVYVATADNNLYCLDVRTGTKIWNYSESAMPFTSPAVAYGNVYVGSRNGYVYAINASSGEKIWNYTTSNVQKGYGIESSPVIANGVLYVGADDGYLYAFEAFTGDALWSYKLGELQHLTCSPAIANGLIYIGSEGTLLTVLGNTETSSQTFLVVLFLLLILTIIIASLIFKYRKYSH